MFLRSQEFHENFLDGIPHSAARSRRRGQLDTEQSCYGWGGHSQGHGHGTPEGGLPASQQSVKNISEINNRDKQAKGWVEANPEKSYP